MGKWTSESTFHWMVYCLDIETGGVVWSREAHTGHAEARSQRRRPAALASIQRKGSAMPHSR